MEYHGFRLMTSLEAASGHSTARADRPRYPFWAALAKTRPGRNFRSAAIGAIVLVFARASRRPQMSRRSSGARPVSGLSGGCLAASAFAIKPALNERVASVASSASPASGGADAGQAARLGWAKKQARRGLGAGNKRVEPQRLDKPKIVPLWIDTKFTSLARGR